MLKKQVFEFPIIYGNIFGAKKLALGWGVHETVADECKAYSIKKALITTTGLKGTGIVDEINQILNRNGIATEIFNKATSNPKDYEAMEAFKVFKETDCDGVVSVGGGSSHDCGKMVRALAANPHKHARDFGAFIDPPWFPEMAKLNRITIPQIAVTTTSGTGAEINGGAVIVNTQTMAKQLALVPGLSPDAGLMDPLLVRCQPRKLAAWTGWDALTHSFEVCVSRLHSEHSTALALRTIKLVSENLREFSYNRMNHVACENMCWAATMANSAISFGAGVGIVHGLGHGLSVLRGVHHGLANAVVTVPLERYNQPVCPERFAEMVEYMGVDTRGMTSMQASDRWFDEIERLLADLDIRTGHLNEQFGLERKDIEHIVINQYSNDFAREGNPRDYNFEECVKLLEDLL
jgi:alcohol dehydrogenase class IV